MTTLTQPKAQIAIGTVSIDGRSYQVRTNPEFVKFFEALVRRAGGVNGDDGGDTAPAAAVSAETVEQLQSDLASLRDQVAEQQRLIDALGLNPSL